MPQPARSSVFCIIDDADASRVLRRAVHAAQSRALVCQRDDYIRRSQHVHGAHALIYDLSPWDDRAVRFLTDVRRQRPYVPILIYAPSGPRVGESIRKATAIGVTRVELHCDGRDECERIARTVSRLIATFPSRMLVPVIRSVIGQVHPRVAEFVDEAVNRALTPNGASQIRPNEVAGARGTGLRTLERDLRKAGLPAPQEFLDWIRLLAICFVSHWNGIATGRVARGIGLTPNALYRLRNRRLSEPPSGKVKRDDEFKAVLTHFARRCQNFSVDADAVLETLVA